MTRHVVTRSDTASDRMKHALTDRRRDLVLRMTTHTVMFPRRDAMIMRTYIMEHTTTNWMLYSMNGAFVELPYCESFMVDCGTVNPVLSP